MSETQLERSVLEAKEREELFAIADALGAKPGARAKKADLVTEILRATGIEPAPSSEVAEKPRRTRARKAVADPAPAPEPVSAPEPASASPHTGSADAPAAGAAPGDGGVAPTLPFETAGAGDAGPADGAAAPLPPAPRGRGTNGDRSATARPARASAPPEVNGSGRSPARVERPQDSEAPPSSTLTASSPSAPAGAAPHSEAEQNNYTDAPGGHVAAGGPPGRPFDNEAGNRRNRRRRGRERFERPDRDLPGQAAEGQYSGEPVPVTGYLDLRDEGYGFLRTGGFLSGPGDVYVSISQTRRFALRKGDYLEGAARPAGGNEKYPALLRIDTVSGLTPEEARERPRFENLTPLFPDQKLRLEVPGDSANMTARIVDLIAPIGKGQRGLIVSPPRPARPPSSSRSPTPSRPTTPTCS